MRDAQISDDAAHRVGILLDSIDRILASEHDRLKDDEHWINPQLPDELRWRVMVLGSSFEDLNFWIRRDDQDGGQWYKLTEIETGSEVGGVTPREACENYFRTDRQ